MLSKILPPLVKNSAECESKSAVGKTTGHFTRMSSSKLIAKLLGRHVLSSISTRSDLEVMEEVLVDRLRELVEYKTVRSQWNDNHDRP